MNPGLDTLSTMAKEAFISTRTSEEAKAVITDVARQSGRTASAYLLWAAAQQDPRIAAALGMSKTTANLNPYTPK